MLAYIACLGQWTKTKRAKGNSFITFNHVVSDSLLICTAGQTTAPRPRRQRPVRRSCYSPSAAGVRPAARIVRLPTSQHWTANCRNPNISRCICCGRSIVVSAP